MSVNRQSRAFVRSTLPTFNPLRRYSIEHASEFLGQSRSQTFDDIKRGRLATIKEGRRRYIPGSEIVRRSRVDGAS